MDARNKMFWHLFILADLKFYEAQHFHLKIAT